MRLCSSERSKNEGVTQKEWNFAFMGVETQPRIPFPNISHSWSSNDALCSDENSRTTLHSPSLTWRQRQTHNSNSSHDAVTFHELNTDPHLGTGRFLRVWQFARHSPEEPVNTQPNVTCYTQHRSAQLVYQYVCARGRAGWPVTSTHWPMINVFRVREALSRSSVILYRSAWFARIAPWCVQWTA